jgi:chromosome segregation ATPase
MCYILGTLLLISIAVSGFLYYRLGCYRRQLDNLRAELAAASDRQSEARGIVERTGELLSQSVTTVAGIRKQISEIREKYEALESLLCSTSGN